MNELVPQLKYRFFYTERDLYPYLNSGCHSENGIDWLASQFGRLDIRDGGAGRFGVWQGPLPGS